MKPGDWVYKDKWPSPKGQYAWALPSTKVLFLLLSVEGKYIHVVGSDGAERSGLKENWKKIMPRHGDMLETVIGKRTGAVLRVLEYGKTTKLKVRWSDGEESIVPQGYTVPLNSNTRIHGR